MNFLGSGKTFDPITDIPDLAGRVFIVTGGNTGLGYETIKQLATHSPAAIYMASRSPDKAEAAITELKKEYPGVNVNYLNLDLSSFESVSKAAKEFIAQSDRLDVLVNNAGIMATPPGHSSEGYEIQFGTNHMGHALFTKLLLPVLESTAAQPDADVRIVNLTSEGHNFARDAPTLLSQEKLNNLSPWVRYGYSKLANIIFTRGLATRYPNITSIAIHPGVIKTNLYLPSAANNPFLRGAMGLVGRFLTTIPEGTKNQLWAAAGPKSELTSGAYYKPIASKSAGSPCARNATLPDQLWEWTEKELASKGY